MPTQLYLIAKDDGDAKKQAEAAAAKTKKGKLVSVTKLGPKDVHPNKVVTNLAVIEIEAPPASKPAEEKKKKKGA